MLASRLFGIRGTAAVLVSLGAALAQNGQDRPSFEVASVKPAAQGGPGLGPLRGGPGTSSPGELIGSASLTALLMRAYGLKSYQVAGPAWMDSARYEVVAKIPAGASKERADSMLQSLLADRFGLVAHRETRDLPIYALVVEKNGPRLKRSPSAEERAPGAPDDGSLAARSAPKIAKGQDGFPDVPGGTDVPRSYEAVLAGRDGLLYKLWARRETMGQLADRLSSQLNRPVVDRTGLKEPYDFVLYWAVENAGGGVPRTQPPPDQIDREDAPVIAESGISIFSAVETQLGLRLAPGRGPLDMLIVDRVQRSPAGN